MGAVFFLSPRMLSFNDSFPCISHLIYFILPNSSLFDIVYKMFTDFENNLALSGLNSDSIGDIIIISKIFSDTRIKGGEIDA